MSYEYNPILCYGFKVENGKISDKDREVLRNGIDEFELRPMDEIDVFGSAWYFGFWTKPRTDRQGNPILSPLDLLSIQSDVDLNRKLMNYARDLCKISTDDIIPSWRVINQRLNH